TAIKHPEIVRKLVVVSAPFKRIGWYPEMISGMEQMGPAAAEALKQTPLFQMYSGLAPRVQDWSKLITKLGILLKQDYDWTDEVKYIKAPTMIVVGDADGVRLTHAVEFFGLLGGDQHDGGWDGSARP